MLKSVPCHVRSSGGICNCSRIANPINAAIPMTIITSGGVSCFFLRFAMFYSPLLCQTAIVQALIFFSPLFNSFSLHQSIFASHLRLYIFVSCRVWARKCNSEAFLRRFAQNPANNCRDEARNTPDQECDWCAQERCQAPGKEVPQWHTACVHQQIHTYHPAAQRIGRD